LALEILRQFGAEVSNVSNANQANQLHFLFCTFSECRDFENIFAAADFLLTHDVDENQTGADGKTPKEYAQKKFGKRNEIIWRVSATLDANSAAELRERAKTRRLSVSEAAEGDNECRKESRPRRRNSFSMADLARVTNLRLH